MVYLTHYSEYPIYEPAEGGYYYAGNEVVEYERLSLRQAKRKFEELIRELVSEDTDERYPWIQISPRFIVRNNYYIGDGESYCIERKLGSNRSGRVIYC